jgi:hypothetical protein
MGARALGTWALMLAFALLGPRTADADRVATGVVDAESHFGDLTGATITWDVKTYSVFGAWDVNLGLVPGINDTEAWAGQAFLGSGLPPSGFYWSEYSSFDPTVLNFSVQGTYVCPNSGLNECGSERDPTDPTDTFRVTYDGSTVFNLSGSLVNNVGPGTLPTMLDGVPVTYSLDGPANCSSPI